MAETAEIPGIFFLGETAGAAEKASVKLFKKPPKATFNDFIELQTVRERGFNPRVGEGRPSVVRPNTVMSTYSAYPANVPASPVPGAQ
jgi:hypothetical protein